MRRWGNERRNDYGNSRSSKCNTGCIGWLISMVVERRWENVQKFIVGRASESNNQIIKERDVTIERGEIKWEDIGRHDKAYW